MYDFISNIAQGNLERGDLKLKFLENFCSLQITRPINLNLNLTSLCELRLWRCLSWGSKSFSKCSKLLTELQRIYDLKFAQFINEYSRHKDLKKNYNSAAF